MMRTPNVVNCFYIINRPPRIKARIYMSGETVMQFFANLKLNFKINSAFTHYFLTKTEGSW
jgi:hypothetical protein